MAQAGPGGPFVDIEGKKISLGEDFSIGPITFYETLRMVAASPFVSYFVKEWNNFLLDLKVGKTSAIILAGVSIGVGGWMAFLVLNHVLFETKTTPIAKKEEPIIARDFTHAQLRSFNGKEGCPVYIAICGEVYDCSSATDYYGEGAAYESFAGRDTTRAMAKFSTEEEDLNNFDISDCNPFERDALENWVNKFKYFKAYPIVGKISIPPNDLKLTRKELSNYIGKQEVPPGRIDAPIYLAVNGKIFDVSYGGKEMYAPNGPYARLAGIDASRALAKMSFDQNDLASHDLSDLEEEQLTTLKDWEERFELDKKYPVVGTIVE